MFVCVCLRYGCVLCARLCLCVCCVVIVPIVVVVLLFYAGLCFELLCCVWIVAFRAF